MQEQDMKCYYRTPNREGKPFLRRLDCPAFHPTEARNAVMEHLNETGEVFINPILILLNGGKS